jgi:hypothetical protein
VTTTTPEPKAPETSPAASSKTQVSNIRMANGEIIPDEWLDYYDGAPSAERAIQEPAGFTERLTKALQQPR